MGSNGRAVEFVKLEQATPKGITAYMKEDGPLIPIRWEKLDLEALKTQHPLIYLAYEKTKEGQTIDLQELMDSPPPASGGENNGTKKKQSKWPGWIDTQIMGTSFALQMPVGEPRGILLFAVGDHGGAMRQIGHLPRGREPWTGLQNKYGLAVLSYDFEIQNYDPTAVNKFIFAENGSGEQAVRALKEFAIQLKKPELADLPILIYGEGRIGAPYGYHFALWKPDRIVAAVVSKGAFYDAEPNETAAALPMLVIWGQYSNIAELWKSENSAEKIFEKFADKQLNWTQGREPRGKSEINPVVIHLAMEYLEKVAEFRLPEKKKEAPPAEPDDNAEAGSKEGEEKEEAEEPEVVEIPPLDRSEGYVGEVKTGKVSKIEDANAALGPGETFLPNKDISDLWKEFMEGRLRPPPPPQL